MQVQAVNFANGDGRAVEVTNVTLLENGTSIDIGFCGNQTALFPVGETVSVNFNPGSSCPRL
jgi:hypothetical protein